PGKADFHTRAWFARRQARATLMARLALRCSRSACASRRQCLSQMAATSAGLIEVPSSSEGDILPLEHHTRGETYRLWFGPVKPRSACGLRPNEGAVGWGQLLAPKVNEDIGLPAGPAAARNLEQSFFCSDVSRRLKLRAGAARAPPFVLLSGAGSALTFLLGA